MENSKVNKLMELVANEHKHFHPSGDSEPSKQDIAITKRLEKASELIGIKFCDHIVIGRGNFFGFRQEKIIGDDLMKE